MEANTEDAPGYTGTGVCTSSNPAGGEGVIHTKVVSEKAHMGQLLQGTLPESMEDTVKLGVLDGPQPVRSWNGGREGVRVGARDNEGGMTRGGISENRGHGEWGRERARPKRRQSQKEGSQKK